MGSLAAAYGATYIPALMMNPMATILVAGIASMASLIGVQYMKPKYIV